MVRLWKLQSLVLLNGMLVINLARGRGWIKGALVGSLSEKDAGQLNFITNIFRVVGDIQFKSDTYKQKLVFYPRLLKGSFKFISNILQSKKYVFQLLN